MLCLLLAWLTFACCFSSSYTEPYVKLTITDLDYGEYSGVYVRGNYSVKCGVNHEWDNISYAPTFFYQQNEGDAYLYNDGSPVTYPDGALALDGGIGNVGNNRLVLTSTTLNSGLVNCSDIDSAGDYILIGVGKFSSVHSDFTGISNGAGNTLDIVWNAQNESSLNVSICGWTDADCETKNPSTAPTTEPTPGILFVCYNSNKHNSL